VTIAQPDFTFDPGTELERLKGQVPWSPLPDGSHLGIHARTHPDHNEYAHFEVFRCHGRFYWRACFPGGHQVGHRYGPFETAKAAYYAAEDHKGG
jgi:hypothetical protein